MLTAVCDHDGALKGFVKISRDETDRRAAQASPREQDVMVGRDRTLQHLRRFVTGAGGS